MGADKVRDGEDADEGDVPTSAIDDVDSAEEGTNWMVVSSLVLAGVLLVLVLLYT